MRHKLVKTLKLRYTGSWCNNMTGWVCSFKAKRTVKEARYASNLIFGRRKLTVAAALEKTADRLAQRFPPSHKAKSSARRIERFSKLEDDALRYTECPNGKCSH